MYNTMNERLTTGITQRMKKFLEMQTSYLLHWLYNNIKITKYKITQLTAHEALFFLSFGIFLFFSIVNTSFYATYLAHDRYDMILVVCVILLVIRELLLHRMTLKSFIGLVLTGLLCLLVLINISNVQTASALIVMALLIYSSRDISFTKNVKLILVLTIFAMIFIILSGYVGLITNYQSIRPNDIARQYLGFRYALYPAGFLFNVSLLEIYLHREKITWKRLFILTLANYWIFLQTDGRLSFYLYLALLIVAVVMKLKKRSEIKNKTIRIFMLCSYVLAVPISFVCTLLYQPSSNLWRKFDAILGGRLSLGQSSLMKYGVSLLGNRDIVWVGNGLDRSGQHASGAYLYVDNLYIQISQRLGVLFLGAIIILLTLLLFYAWKHKNGILMICLTAVAIRCLIDDLSFYLYYNAFWLLIGTMIYTRKSLYPHRFWHTKKIRGIGSKT